MDRVTTQSGTAWLANDCGAAGGDPTASRGCYTCSLAYMLKRLTPVDSINTSRNIFEKNASRILSYNESHAWYVGQIEMCIANKNI